MKGKKGWHGESKRHARAAKGIKTGRRNAVMRRAVVRYPNTSKGRILSDIASRAADNAIEEDEVQPYWDVYESATEDYDDTIGLDEMRRKYDITREEIEEAVGYGMTAARREKAEEDHDKD